MTQTPIDMAREVVADLVCDTSPPKLAASARKSIMAGDMCMAQVDAALAMHTRLTAEHQAAVAELVAGLEALSDHRIVVGKDTARLGEIAAFKALIAKHRAPDAFDTWAEGLIDE